MPSNANAIHSGMFGRDTAATMAQWESHILPTVTTAPRLMLGTRPRKSPGNWTKLDWQRYAGQTIGDCVGEAEAHAFAYKSGQSHSALHGYYHGRALCRQRGMRLGAAGCVVSIAADAAIDTGCALYETYPTTDAAYAAYSDRRSPPAAAEADGPTHAIVKKLNIDTFSSLLDYLSIGEVVWVGKPIPSGMMSTRDDGYYQLAGRIVGGHSTLLVDYDEDANQVTEFNSWSNAQWGTRSADPKLDPRCQGHTNLGYTDLDAMERVFNARSFASGEVEAVVLLDLKGVSRVRSFSEVLD